VDQYNIHTDTVKYNPQFYVKLHSIEVHDLAMRPLAIQVYSITDDVNTQSVIVGTQQDYPSRNAYARCKYVWPLASRTTPCLAKSGEKNTVYALIYVGKPISKDVDTTMVSVTITGSWIDADQVKTSSLSGTFVSPKTFLSLHDAVDLPEIVPVVTSHEDNSSSSNSESNSVPDIIPTVVEGDVKQTNNV